MDASLYFLNIFGCFLTFGHIYGDSSLDFNIEDDGESIMDAFGSILDTVADYADGNEKCDFTCPNGEHFNRTYASISMHT